MALVAGPFAATYAPSDYDPDTYAIESAVSIGDTEGGFELLVSHKHEPVHTDRGGDTEVNGIQRGTVVEVRLTSVDYAGILPALHAQNLGVPGDVKSAVGTLLTMAAGQLKLTPLAGTPAAAEAGTGKSYYFYRAVVKSDIRKLMSSKLRKGPLTFHCYPVPTLPAGITNAGKIYEIKT